MTEASLIIAIISLVLSFATSLTGSIIALTPLRKRFEPRITLENDKIFIMNIGRGIGYHFFGKVETLDGIKIKLLGLKHILIPKNREEIKLQISQINFNSDKNQHQIKTELIDLTKISFIIINYKTERRIKKKKLISFLI